MRAVVTLLAAIVAVLGSTAQAATAPKLQVLGQQPLTVRGEAFRPGERIVVTALTPTGPKRLVVRSTPSGRFGVTFRLPNQPCSKAFAVRAIGGLGSRAALTVRSRPCVPPPID